MGLFGFIREAKDPRYRNRGSLSSIGEHNERFLAGLFNLRLTDGRERGRGYPDLAGKKLYSGIQYYVEAKSAVSPPSMNGGGKSKWVIYASQICLEDVVRGHLQSNGSGQQASLKFYDDWGVEEPEDARVYHAFVKRIGEKGYAPQTPLGMFCFQYADIYLLRCDLVKPLFILKFLIHYKDNISSLGDEKAQVQEILMVLEMIKEGRAKGIQHRLLMNELKQRYARGEISINPELFGIQSKKKGGLRGWDSVLESELYGLVQKGGLWERLERIPGIKRGDYDCVSLEGVSGYSLWFVDHDDKCLEPFAHAVDKNRERMTDLGKIRFILSHTSFIPAPKKHSLYISKKTSEAIWKHLIERYGHGVFDDVANWRVSALNARHMLWEVQDMIQGQSM